jgi:hypothetical protein
MYSDEQIRQIILDIQSESEFLRDKALKDFHDTTDSRFVTIALEMLNEEDYEPVRAAIVTLRNLSNFNPPQFLPRVTQFLEVPSHCSTAIWFIWSLGDASYVPRIIKFLADDDSETRYQTLRTIARYGYHDLLEIALYMSNDVNGEIRGLACGILGRFRESRVIDVLIAKLRDFDDALVATTVSGVAAGELEKIGDKCAVQPLMDVVRFGDEESAFRAIWALWKIEQAECFEFLLEQCKHPSEKVRREIMNILAKILDVSSVDTLIWVVQNDSSLYVQSGAVYVLAGIGTPKALRIVDEWKAKHRRNDDT